MTLFPKMCAILVLALGCSLAVAAPKDDLHAAFTKFLAARSFRATATDVKKGEQVSKMEFVAPDRYRVDAAGGQASLIVGDTMYMDLGGKLTPVPVPGVGKMVARYRNPEFLGEMEAGMEVKALGNEAVDGEPAKVYACTLTKPLKSEAKMWISENTGMPIQIESTGSFMGHATTTRVRYSGFDDPSIRIDAP
jgi:outer membrane lipoprotein-sorting protein